MDRGDYSARITYTGPPVKPPRPWYLHPAFIVIVILVLSGTGYALKDQFRVMQMRAKGVNVEMVDGKPVVQLPQKATIIGNEWKWREFDNSENRYGLGDGHDHFVSEQEWRAENRDMASEYEMDPDMAARFELPDYEESQYDYRYWAALSPLDLDGSGRQVIPWMDGKRQMYFDPLDGWHSLSTGGLHPKIDAEHLLAEGAWWDHDRDGVPDRVRVYGIDYENIDWVSVDWSSMDNGSDVVVIDGATGRKLKSWKADGFTELHVADFDGDGHDELAYRSDGNFSDGYEITVRGKDGQEIGQLQLESMGIKELAWDSDGDGSQELVTDGVYGGIVSAALGGPQRELHDENGWSLTCLLDLPGGGEGLLLCSDPMRRMMDFGDYMDMDFMNNSDTDSQKMMEDIQSSVEEMERFTSQLMVDSPEPMSSPAYALDSYSHFQSLPDSLKQQLRLETAWLDRQGMKHSIGVPEEYSHNNINSSYSYWIDSVRPPGHAGRQMFVPPAQSGGLLVMATDGSSVHYEEFGEIPLYCGVVRGQQHDWIVTAFEDRILVYP